MTFFGDGSGSSGGHPGSSVFGKTASRTDILGKKYAPFANPFFDQASTYTPPTVKSLFGFCRYYYLTHGVINAITTKSAEYPITDIIFQHRAEGVRSKWEELVLGTLNYRVHQFQMNLDYFCYGNAFASPSFPFRKKIICAICNAKLDAIDTRKQWRYTNFRFWLMCPKCGQTDYAKSYDEYYMKPAEIGMIRWNPENMTIFYNESTGRLDYALDLSQQFRGDILMGRKDLVATTPEIFLDAAKTRRMLIFDKREVFHMARPALSSQQRGWGTPQIMPVLKDAFYMQIMKKAQETVLLTHLLPQIFLFPQPAAGSADPFCVAPNTLVEVPEGVLPASEIQKGDLLRSHLGAFRRVEEVVRRPVPQDEKVYEITAMTLPGFPFRVSEEHPILAAKSSYKKKTKWSDTAITDLEFIEPKFLEVDDYVGYPVKRSICSNLTLDLAEILPERAATEDWVYLRYSQQGAHIYEYIQENGIPVFKSGPTAELAKFLDQQGWDRKQYDAVRASVKQDASVQRHPRWIELDQDWMRVIGYYLAEGSTDQYQHVVTFTFHSEEQSYIDELVISLNALGYETEVDRREDQNCAVVRVNNTVLSHLLRKLCGRYSVQRRIPTICAEAPDDMCWEMLRCLYNGDGTYITADQKGTSRAALKTISPHLALEARRLLLSFGYVCGVSKKKPPPTARAKSTYYQVYLNGVEGERLAQAFGWEDDPKQGVPKRHNAFLRDGYLYMRIKKISIVEESEVIGFQMSTDRTFCVAGVATHNTTVNLTDWRAQVQRELARQRLDPSYYGVIPFPLGHQIIGDNGRQLLLMPEIRQMAELVAIGMGFPIDLVFGQGNYAGTSVSMRMLENFFLSNVSGQYRLLQWTLKRLSAYMGWEVPDARFKPFKMADDLQRQAYTFQLNQAGKLSDTTMLAAGDWSVEDETELQMKEAHARIEAQKKQQLALAEIQGESNLIMAKYQMKSQEQMDAAAQSGPSPDLDQSVFGSAQSSALNSQQPGAATTDVVNAVVSQLQQMDPQLQQQQLQMLGEKSPTLAQMVSERLQAGGGRTPSTAVDMRPAPEALPPRRGPTTSLS